MDLIEKINRFIVDAKTIVGTDPSSHAFTRHTGQMKRNKPVTVKGSPAERKKKEKDFDAELKKWREEEKRKKYGYTKKNR